MVLEYILRWMSQDVSPKIRVLSDQELRDKHTEVEVALPLQQTRTSALGASFLFFFQQRIWAGGGTRGALNRNCLQTYRTNLLRSIWKRPAARSGNQRFAPGWTQTGDLGWGTPCWRSCSLYSRGFLSGKRLRTRRRWLAPTGGTRGDTFTCRRRRTSTTSTWRSA